MRTDWDDPELNPPGLKLVEDNPVPRNVTVSLSARVIADFKDKNGNSFLSAFVGDKTRVFKAGEHGYQEVEDAEIRLILRKMTEEVMEERRK